RVHRRQVDAQRGIAEEQVDAAGVTRVLGERLHDEIADARRRSERREAHERPLDLAGLGMLRQARRRPHRQRAGVVRPRERDDELHKRQRRLAQPAFHRDRITLYADEMVQRAARTRERWRDGATLDIHHEMMKLTLSVVAKTLFDAEVEGEEDDIGSALTSLIDLFPLLMNPYSVYFRKIPIPSTLRFKKAITRLDRTIYGIINERRASGEDRGD